MKRCLLLSIVALLVGGCSSTSVSNYTYHAQANDPKLAFIAEFDENVKFPVHFGLNITSPESSKCSDFDDIGYYFPEGNFFILAKENKDLRAQVPANKPVTLKGHYSVGGEGSCRTPVVQFIAESGKEYLINFKQKNKFCKLEITDKNTAANVDFSVIARGCTR